MATAPYCEGNVLQSSCPSGKAEPVLDPPQLEDPLEAGEGADHAAEAEAEAEAELEGASKN